MAAHKGNKYSTGRKPHYDTPEALQEAIEEYFVFCEGEYHMEEKENKDGELIEVKVYDRYPVQPTISGICLYLGFESRQSFYDYADKESFSYTIKRARLMLECEYEQMLATKAVTGAIFALKNLGWKDKTELEHTGKDGKDLPMALNVTVVSTDIPIANSERDLDLE